MDLSFFNKFKSDQEKIDSFNELDASVRISLIKEFYSAIETCHLATETKLIEQIPTKEKLGILETRLTLLEKIAFGVLLGIIEDEKLLNKVISLKTKMGYTHNPILRIHFLVIYCGSESVSY